MVVQSAALRREPSARGDHRFRPFVNGLDDFCVVDPSQVSERDRSVGMSELPLDHDQPDPLARHLDCVRMAMLV
jgi:hypothetical protein